MNKDRHSNVPSTNILQELLRPEKTRNGNSNDLPETSSVKPLLQAFRQTAIQEPVPGSSPNVCDSSILNLAIQRSKGSALKPFPKEGAKVPKSEVTTCIENLELSKLSKTALESKENIFNPRVILRADDPNFTPVDVAKGPLMVLVTSPMTNQVGVFQDNLYTGTLDLPGSKYFNKPRNVLYIPKSPTSGYFLILDESGVRVFTEGGKYLTTMLKGNGHQYRGLAYYQCWKKFAEDDQSDLFIVMLRAQVLKSRNHLCIFRTREPFDSINEVRNIPISNADGDATSRCRFVSVSSSCEPLKGCLGHLAFVTDLGKSALYKINLSSGQSCTALLEGDRNLDATFADVPSDSSKKFSFIGPTGITIDNMGNIYVADKDSYCIEMFAPNGLWLRSLRVFCRPLGIDFDHINKFVLVVDHETKTIVGFKFSLGG